MIGRGDDDRVDVLAFEHAAEITELGAATADQHGAFVHARREAIADAADFDIGLFFETVRVNLADEAETDDADIDAFVRAEHAAGGKRGEADGGGRRFEEGSS